MNEHGLTVLKKHIPFNWRQEYVHYLLVDPAYHGDTIGRTLVEMVKEHYKDYLRVAVIAYDNESHFYENCGFERSKDASPMFITSLWT